MCVLVYICIDLYIYRYVYIYCKTCTAVWSFVMRGHGGISLLGLKCMAPFSYCRFQVHSFDRCCWSFKISLLESMFESGSVTKVDPEYRGEYRGKQISMIKTKDGKIRSTTRFRKSFIPDESVRQKVCHGKVEERSQAEQWRALQQGFLFDDFCR